MVPDWGDPFGNPEQIMALWPTGGTTGRSKAVMMTNLAATNVIMRGHRRAG